MSHDILCCFNVHTGPCHISASSMSHNMRRELMNKNRLSFLF
nr:MAG TPA: hypothetical protein [Caudoviricetes sp.]